MADLPADDHDVPRQAGLPDPRLRRAGRVLHAFLSVTLLWLLNKQVPAQWRNKAASNVMVVIAAAFIALAVNELQKAVRGA